MLCRGRWLYFRAVLFILVGSVLLQVVRHFSGQMSEQTLDYFLSQGLIGSRDAALVKWAHAANSKHKLTEALQGGAHMIEADVLMRGRDPREPIMAHPPDNDSDITLREWLQATKTHNKGIKLDFKSLEAVAPSMAVLEGVWPELSVPVWMNADILHGPGGQHVVPLEPTTFLRELAAHGSHPMVLSLGWTTGWTPAADNPGTSSDVRNVGIQTLPDLTLRNGSITFGTASGTGYSWEMVREMEEVCRSLQHPVTFPVRASLISQSLSQLTWLLQQSHRYSLTVWTSQSDQFVVQDLLPYRKDFDKSKIYFDLPEEMLRHIQ